MIYALFFLVLLSIFATVWLARAVFRLRREHARALRQVETTHREARQSLAPTIAENATSEDLRRLALLLDGVASASLRLEQRVAALERAHLSAAPNSSAVAPKLAP